MSYLLVMVIIYLKILSCKCVLLHCKLISCHLLIMQANVELIQLACDTHSLLSLPVFKHVKCRISLVLPTYVPTPNSNLSAEHHIQPICIAHHYCFEHINIYSTCIIGNKLCNVLMREIQHLIY